jgi:hypothetical protein
MSPDDPLLGMDLRIVGRRGHIAITAERLHEQAGRFLLKPLDHFAHKRHEQIARPRFFALGALATFASVERSQR